jgi:hypothetical protein
MAGETEVLGENPPSATVSTIYPRQPDLPSTPGHHGGKTTNRLNYGTVPYFYFYNFYILYTYILTYI